LQAPVELRLPVDETVPGGEIIGDKDAPELEVRLLEIQRWKQGFGGHCLDDNCPNRMICRIDCQRRETGSEGARYGRDWTIRNCPERDTHSMSWGPPKTSRILTARRHR